MSTFAELLGKELGPTEWFEIDQARIDEFARATNDPQWIHTDPGRAAQGPFGTTIAHGFLTLSLCVPLMTASLGLTVQPVTPQIARSLGLDATVRGVVIVNVDPDSDAAGKGFQRGYVIVAANGVPVASAADLARVVAAAKAQGRPSVLLLVQARSPSGQQSRQYVAVDIAE